MTYDPLAYWTDPGLHIAGPGRGLREHRRQERALERLLSPLDWTSVLEVGVGAGRITALITRIRPDAAYTGIDIGRSQLETGRKMRPDGRFIQAALEDFRPADRWDLVVVSEVLMHIVPWRVEDAVRNLIRLARRHVVAVEWVPLPGELDGEIAPWNFPHDYASMLAPVSQERTDRQVIFHREVSG